METKEAWTGSKAKQLRLELDLSQIEFAKLLGLPPGTIATVEARSGSILTGALQFVFSVVSKGTVEERKNLALSKKAVVEALEKIKI